MTFCLQVAQHYWCACAYVSLAVWLHIGNPCRQTPSSSSCLACLQPILRFLPNVFDYVSPCLQLAQRFWNAHAIVNLAVWLGMETSQAASWGACLGVTSPPPHRVESARVVVGCARKELDGDAHLTSTYGTVSGRSWDANGHPGPPTELPLKTCSHLYNFSGTVRLVLTVQLLWLISKHCSD